MVAKIVSHPLQRVHKTCTGCCKPFVKRQGWSQAIVGRDSRLYCYGTACEQNALERQAARRAA